MPLTEIRRIGTQLWNLILQESHITFWMWGSHSWSFGEFCLWILIVRCRTKEMPSCEIGAPLCGAWSRPSDSYSYTLRTRVLKSTGRYRRWRRDLQNVRREAQSSKLFIERPLPRIVYPQAELNVSAVWSMNVCEGTPAPRAGVKLETKISFFRHAVQKSVPFLLLYLRQLILTLPLRSFVSITLKLLMFFCFPLTPWRHRFLNSSLLQCVLMHRSIF